MIPRLTRIVFRFGYLTVNIIEGNRSCPEPTHHLYTRIFSGVLSMQLDVADRPEALAFDIFGTVLDLAGSLTPRLSELLDDCGAQTQVTTLWAYWRMRQRIEQYQDNLLMLGHSGYLAVVRRSLLYTLRTFKVAFSESQVDEFMLAYQQLDPFDDAVA